MHVYLEQYAQSRDKLKLNQVADALSSQVLKVSAARMKISQTLWVIYSSNVIYFGYTGCIHISYTQAKLNKYWNMTKNI